MASVLGEGHSMIPLRAELCTVSPCADTSSLTLADHASAQTCAQLA